MDLGVEGKPDVALRILEARKAYAAEFDYRAMRDCVDEVIGEGNVRLMQEHMAASLETVGKTTRRAKAVEDGGKN